MGLASYGNEKYFEELREFIKYHPDDGILFDPYDGIYDWLIEKIRRSQNPFKVRADLAFAAQAIFEEVIVRIGKDAYKRNKNRTLCYGGGCALNGSANYRLQKEGPFEKVFIFPAAGDNGLSTGAALYGYVSETGKTPYRRKEQFRGLNAYLGCSYSDEEIQIALEKFSFFSHKPNCLIDFLVQRLLNDEIVPVFRNSSEVGPRALGNRSILAMPHSLQIRDKINLSVKNRESFRPLAPVVTEEDCSKYFEILTPSPFMLSISPVKKEYSEQLSGVCHIDGTARVQTINEDTNPFLHSVLKRVGKATGIPVLLNTSFNLRGKPIVESPFDALEAFSSFPLNTMVIGTRVVEKYGEWIPGSENLSGRSVS